MIIGVTGSFGAGKSFVASVLAGCGAEVIDADKKAHELILRGSNPYRRIVAAFGEAILGADGEIERGRLAAIAFQDKRNIKILNGLIHPAVISFIKKEVARARRERTTLVIDAPLLIEAGLHKAVDRLIVVTSTRNKQLCRGAKKFGITKKDAADRIKCQMPLSSKIKYADYVISNDGTKSQTKKRVIALWRKGWK